MEDFEKLKEENEKLKDELASYKIKGAMGYFYELNRFTNSTVAFMRETSVKGLLNGASKDEDAKKFEKVMALIKNTKGWIDDMEDIKSKLGLTGDEEKDKSKKPFIERIADKRD